MAVKRILVFSGNANPELAEEIAKVLGTPLGEARVSRFSDGETYTLSLHDALPISSFKEAIRFNK